MELENIEKPKFTVEEMFGFKEKGLVGSLVKVDAKLKQNDTSVEKLLPKLEEQINTIINELNSNTNLTLNEVIKEKLLTTIATLNEKGYFQKESVEIKNKLSLDSKNVEVLEVIPFEGFNSSLSIDRVKLVKEMQDIGMNPYDNTFKPNLTQKQFNINFDVLPIDKKICLVGKITNISDNGNITFIKLERDGVETQILLQKNKINENNKFKTENLYKNLKHFLQLGDIVGINGNPYLTSTGEKSLNANSLAMISKPLLPTSNEISDEKTLALYPELNLDFERNMKLRSEIMYTIEDYFRGNSFVRVETPMLHTTAGGAAAEPFKTHHNSIGEDRHLRIAPELFLKRMMVGGLEKVYEMNRNFRNEGMDATHNPEFTSIEFYQAYSDYKEMMMHTETLIDLVRQKLNLNNVIDYQGMKIDLTVPFKKIGYDQSIIEIGNVDSNVLSSKENMIKYIKDNFDVKGKDIDNMNVGKLKEFLFEELVEEKLINPTFITDYPIEISPLARKNDKNPNIADRFELFIGKKEYANGFSELNDPKDQYDRFKKQLDEKAKGDVEAMEMDPSFITSLSYGMTSAGGCGLGIDRLTMLMGNMGTIKQAIAFPATKTQAKIDLTIGEKDRVKKDIEEIVKEVLDIIQIKEELSLLKNYLRKKAKAINNEDIEALKNVLEDLVDLKESIK